MSSYAGETLAVPLYGSGPVPRADSSFDIVAEELARKWEETADAESRARLSQAIGELAAKYGYDEADSPMAGRDSSTDVTDLRTVRSAKEKDGRSVEGSEASVSSDESADAPEEPAEERRGFGRKVPAPVPKEPLDPNRPRQSGIVRNPTGREYVPGSAGRYANKMPDPETETARPQRRGSDALWFRDAICVDEDPELFFPVGTSGPALRMISEAKEVCARCPVSAECLTEALEKGYDYGVWGGMSEDERRDVKRGGAQIRRDQGDGRIAESLRSDRAVV